MVALSVTSTIPGAPPRTKKFAKCFTSIIFSLLDQKPLSSFYPHFQSKESATQRSDLSVESDFEIVSFWFQSPCYLCHTSHF